MKNNKIMAVGIIMMLPLASMAQENIKKAFDAIINDNSLEISTTHKLNKDPETGKKKGQLDVYEFTIPIAKKQMVKDVERAFDKDMDKAYTVNSGNPGKTEYDYASLAVGGGSSYMLGAIKGSRYIYALFMDPMDEEKIYRYAYVMEWKEGKSEIEGKLVVTYATTAQYRSKSNEDNMMDRVEQLKKRATELKKRYGLPSVSAGDNNVVVVVDNAHVWMTKFQMFKKWFLEAKGDRKNSQALNIYHLCKDVSSLNAEEKELIFGELQNLKKNAEDELTLKMFDMSIEQLKK